MTNANQTKGRRVAAVAAAVLALAGAAGTVFGQSAAEAGKKQPKHEEFSKPLGGKAAKGQPAGGNVQMHFSENDGDDQYELTIRGDDISAKVNGKKVPQDRIRREDGTVQILDEDGDVVKEFEIGGMGGGAWAQQAPRGNAYRWLGGGEQPGVQAMPAPKVMIGITMSEPDEKAAERAGLKAGEGIVIADIIDGLPADEAGLKKGDIILSIDGSDGALDQAKFRERINKKDPGDKVELTISRKGDKKTIEVELKAWDPEKLGMGAPMPAEGLQGFRGGEGLSREQLDEARKQFEGALKQRNRMRQRGPGQPPEPPDGAGRRDHGGPEVWAAPDEHGQWKEFMFGDGENPEGLQFFMQPFQDRTEELNKRLDDLQEKLDRLNEKLDKIAETLDRVNGKK